MLDFHVHLARLPEPQSTAKELEKAGYKAVVVACEPWEWNASAPLFSKYPSTFTPCFGIHPMIASQILESDLETLKSWIQRFPQAYVGECGLDKRYPGYAPGDVQEKIFEFQAKLALEFRRPLMIHMVGDYRRIFQIFERIGFTGSNAFPIFHRFGGDKEIIKKAIPLNALFSIHRDSFRKASTKAALGEIPKSKVRFETDADESFPVEAPDGTKKAPYDIAQALIQNLKNVEENWQRI
ncbi:MAG: TatD family hydrolase [Fibrobacter sp.]|nr:TatD family hydrolase [Fibrobacter sp.]